VVPWFAEAVVMMHAPEIGSNQARDLGYLAGGQATDPVVTFKQTLLINQEMNSDLTAADADRLIHSVNYIGFAVVSMDAVLYEVQR
jgi:adenylosuccinate lyase